MIKVSPFTIRYRMRREDDDPEFGGGGIRGLHFYDGGGFGTPRPKRSASKSAAKSATKSASGKSGSAKGGGAKAGKAASKKASGKKASGKGSGKKASAKSAGGAKGRARGAKRAVELPPRLAFLGAAAPELVGPLASLNPNLTSTLLESSLSHSEVGEDWERSAVERLRPVVEDLGRGVETVTVAVWDIDARVGLLPNVIEALNESQETFTFFDLQASIPAGLVVRSEYFDEWIEHRTKKRVEDFTAWVRDKAEKKRVSEDERRGFGDNLWSNDFYKYARVIYKQLGVDYLAGVTQYKVAGHEKGDYFWDYFSASQKGVLLTSAFDLREYARDGGRPFEVAVAQVVLAQLLVEIGPRVRFHEDRGCFFDFNESRDSIVRSIREMRVEPECMEKIDARYRGAAQSMADALRDYKRPQEFVLAAEAERREESLSPKHDDKYWLKQLNLLSAKAVKGQKR
jgi:hypothetical protein